MFSHAFLRAKRNKEKRKSRFPPNLPDEIMSPIARHAHPADAAKLRRLSRAHSYIVTKRDLAWSVALLLFSTRNSTAPVHLWSKIYKNYPLLSRKPDVVLLILEALLHLGADVQSGGFAALIAAADVGHDGPVHFLIQHGVNIHAWSDMALCRVSKLGHINIVRILLRAGARVNEQDGRPLCAAAEYGHDEIVRLLIRHGACLNNVGMRHDGALCAAAKNNKVQVIHTLMDAGKDVFSQDDYAKALRTASGNGHNAVVKVLLQRGVDVSLHEDAALFSAAANGRDEVVRTLIEAGAGHLNEALQGAEYWGRDSVVKILMEAGAVRRGPITLLDEDGDEELASITGGVDGAETDSDADSNVESDDSLGGSSDSEEEEGAEEDNGHDDEAPFESPYHPDQPVQQGLQLDLDVD